MAFSLHVSLLLLASLTVTAQAHFAHSYANVYRWPTPEIRYQYATLPPLTVIEEDAYSMDDKMARVPLVLVPSNRLKVVQGGAIYYQQEYQGLPAIRLVLPRPMYVSRPTTMIDFPSSFTVIHDGYRVPVTIAAVLAPVYTISAPQEIRVVYAVPTQTTVYPSFQPIRKPIQPINPPSSISSSTYYPLNQDNTYLPPTNSYKLPTNNYKPINSYIPPTNNYQHPSNSLQPPTNEYLPPPSNSHPTHQPSSQTSHQGTSGIQSGVSDSQPGVSGGHFGSSAPNRPVVTILDFPNSVATPGALFFQPALDPDTELGNREPPQGVVPAGIVQSTAPLPNLSLFINSKESEILQSLRDEAQKHRLTSNAYNSDYEIIIN